MSLSAEEVAKRLNLDAWIIQALEAEDFGRLPERIYVRGYLNAYCKLLNQSSEPICTRFIQDEYRFSVLPAGSLVQKVPVARRATSWLWPAAAAVLAALGLGMSYGPLESWLQSALHQAPPDDDGAHAPAVQATPAPTPTDRAAPTEDAAPAVQSKAFPTTSSTTPQPLVKAMPEDYQPPSEGEHSNGAIAATKQSPVTAATSAANSKGQGPDRVELRLTEASWAELKDAAGKRLVWGTLNPGAHVFAGAAPFDLTLGHPQGASIDFNGKPHVLQAAQKKAVVRLTLGGAPKPSP
jgi:cytoskeleton protein RodZ